MKIAFDISQSGQDKAGCGYMAYGVAQELVEQQSCVLTFLRSFGDSWWDPLNQEIKVPNAPAAKYMAGFEKQSDAIAFWQQTPKAIQEALGNPDIIHSNNFFSPPRMPDTRQVYTLHDMTVFDCPQFTTEVNRTVCLRGTMKAACNADAVVAVSEATKSNFLEYFSFDPDRIVVAPLGSRFANVGGSKQPADLSAKDPFIVAVGTIEPRKNYDTLLQAFKIVAGQENVTLVIAGKTGWHMESFDLGPAALGLQDRVRLLSYVSDAELAWLYQHCIAFVYPSLWEGFGLPVLEALSRGCPVVSSRSTSLPEVTGKAALLFDPDNPEQLAERIVYVVRNKGVRDRMRKEARVRAARFSWSRTAELVREAYHIAVTAPRRRSAAPSRFGHAPARPA